MYFKIIVLKVCKFHRKTPVSESSLIKLQALRTPSLLKRDSNTGFFPRNLRNFYEQLLADHLRMTASCVYLRILRSFSEHLIYRATLRNWLFYLQVTEFQPPDTISQVLFKHIIQQRQVPIKRYWKSLKTIYEEVNL